MPYAGDTYSLPAGTAAVANSTASASDVNARFTDLETAQNTARPIAGGGTGATTASGARTNLGAQAADTALDAIVDDGTDHDWTIPAGGAVRIQDTTGGVDIGRFFDNGGGQLLYQGTQRVSATSGGVALTGTITLDGSALILDEDNMASDSATQVPSQQSVKAYVDAQVADLDWTYVAPVDATGQSAVTFSSLPAGLNDIEVLFFNTNFSNRGLVQLSTGAAFVTTGYVSTSRVSDADSTSTAGFIFRQPGDGKMNVFRFESGANVFVSNHGVSESAGAGRISLGGEVDGIRVVDSGGANITSGNIALRYK